ncbi:MAG TPA: galactokinase [Vicinamibacterales bacterium]|nr:galactokinase [Vicinamibacterales bacterium]
MIEVFRRTFGRDAEVTGRAPGRVNLIGEHTDYNGGYVLPTALPQETHVLMARRDDQLVRACSVDLGAEHVVTFELGSEQRTHGWIDYVQGVTWALAERGARLSGVDMLVSSNVPIGKGLSSSASLEVAVGRALRDMFHLQLDDVDIAMAGHRAETSFVGAPVGIMDQMVCSLGDRSTALFLDAWTKAFEKVPIPDEIELGVIDSGIAHSHASGEYRTRRHECDEAAALLGVETLRHRTVDDLPQIARLPDPLNRRAQHVVTENARVLRAVDALRRGDAALLGRLFLESHGSMRDDFEVSVPDIDRLVEIAASDSRTYGARLTGGGFGGAIVVLCHRGEALDVTRRTVEAYHRATRRNGQVLIPDMHKNAA